MTTDLKDFKPIAKVRPDSKKRITLGKTRAMAEEYEVLESESGELLLIPLASLPANEIWLWKKKALNDIIEGIKQAQNRKFVKGPEEDFSKYLDK